MSRWLAFLYFFMYDNMIVICNLGASQLLVFQVFYVLKNLSDSSLLFIGKIGIKSLLLIVN